MLEFFYSGMDHWLIIYQLSFPGLVMPLNGFKQLLDTAVTCETLKALYLLQRSWTYNTMMKICMSWTEWTFIGLTSVFEGSAHHELGYNHYLHHVVSLNSTGSCLIYMCPARTMTFINSNNFHQLVQYRYVEECQHKTDPISSKTDLSRRFRLSYCWSLTKNISRHAYRTRHQVGTHDARHCMHSVSL